MTYRLEMATGLRASELAALTPALFELEATPPRVTLKGKFTKNGEPAVQPLPSDMVERLREFMKVLPRDRPLFPGTWVERSADMIKLDLADAGIPYHDEQGRVADFHALRHSFITAVVNAPGVTLVDAQALARHKDIKTTLRYSHTNLHRLGNAVNALPALD